MVVIALSSCSSANLVCVVTFDVTIMYYSYIILTYSGNRLQVPQRVIDFLAWVTVNTKMISVILSHANHEGIVVARIAVANPDGADS